MIDVYSWPTPNGHKVHIALEELGLDYQVHGVNIGNGDQFNELFLEISPNNKIPAITDDQGPDGKPISIFESGAILLYLAEKTGQLLPEEPRARYAVLEWLMFQMGGLGPMFGQMGFFYKFAGAQIEDPRPRERYRDEAIRLLAVLDKELAGKDWIAGDYSIADMAIAPWVNALGFYGTKDEVGYDDLKNVPAYVARFFERPAVEKAMNIPPRP